MVTHHDGVPIWARPLAYVPKGMGEEMSESVTQLRCSLLINWVSYAEYEERVQVSLFLGFPP